MGRLKILRQDRIMMNMEISGYAYHGGAHGVDLTSYINWNLKKNKPVTLDNILDSGYLKPLTSIAEQMFRKNEKLSDTSSLNNGRTLLFQGREIQPAGYLFADRLWYKVPVQCIYYKKP